MGILRLCRGGGPGPFRWKGVLHGYGPLHLKGATDRNVLRLDVPLDLQRTARLDVFRGELARDAGRPRTMKFLNVDVPFENAGPRNPGDLRIERTLDFRATRGNELDGPHRVATHDAAANDLDRLVAELGANAGKVHRAHRLTDRADCVASGPGGLRRGLSDHVPDRGAEIRVR